MRVEEACRALNHCFSEMSFSIEANCGKDSASDPVVVDGVNNGKGV